MKVQPDYPAAHSMDTEWFAVDRDGHVAHFVSGEAGAVPEAAYLGEDYGELVDQVRALPKCAAALDPESPFAPDLNSPTHGALVDCGAVVFLDSLEPVKDELARGEAKERRATRGAAVELPKLTAELHKRLHDSGACRGCRFWSEEETTLAENGVYSYEHLSENIFAGPYGRNQVPLEPLKVEQLPPALREAVSQARFEHVCFAEAGQIQPAAHLKSAGWDGAWVDAASKEIRPLTGEGMAKVFLENYGPEGQLRADLEAEGFKIAAVEVPPKKPWWKRLFS